MPLAVTWILYECDGPVHIAPRLDKGSVLTMNRHDLRSFRPEYGYGFDTVAIREGQSIDCADVNSEPLALTNSYIFSDPLDAELKFTNRRKGHVYSRMSNPTVDALEKRLGALEGAEETVAFASGMAAVDAIFWTLLKRGDHVVCAREIFGTSSYLLQKYYTPLGIDVDFVDVRSVSEWKNAIRTNTRLLFLETPANPNLRLGNIRQLASIPKPSGCQLVVDNTVATPVIQRPLGLGADAVIHSAGKYIDGQGRVMGGLVATSHELAQQLRAVLRDRGPCLSPFNAWSLLKSLETLSIRMRAHSQRARAIVEWLNRSPYVTRVNYPHGKKYDQTRLALQQHLDDDFHGGLLSFTIQGDKNTAWAIMEQLQLITISTNIGDTKSLITHPATTTHVRASPEERAKADISDCLLRISVGLEHEGDLIDDLKNAFDLVFKRMIFLNNDYCQCTSR